MSQKLVIMRHASYYALNGKHPLSQEGQLETIAATQEVLNILQGEPINAAYYSPFCRTEQTAKIAAAVSRGTLRPFNGAAKNMSYDTGVKAHKADWLNMLEGDYIANIRELPDGQNIVLLVTHDHTMNAIASEIAKTLNTWQARRIKKGIENVSPLKASGVVLDTQQESWKDLAKSNLSFMGDFVCGGMSSHLQLGQELEPQIQDVLAL